MNARFKPENFPSGLVVTSVEECKILFANDYFYKISQDSAVTRVQLHDYFTPASNIVIESFIMPLLLDQGQCSEIQLTLHTDEGARIPVLINARIDIEQQQIYWVISTAQQRDNLYQQLVNLRNDLEVRAEKLEILSQTDDLTGLLNRRAFVIKANELMRQAKRYNDRYSFIMLDIDHFKHINDQYGHTMGDKVIQHCAERLTTNCRAHDIVARIGGEEFAIFMLNRPEDSAERFAEKLLTLFNSEPILTLNVTVSIGAVTSDNASYEALYQAADNMLYQAKKRGRNRVCY